MMKILLTSFGIADAINRESSKEESIFYRMPPVIGAVHSRFAPDYSALLLCEKIILDESTYNALEQGPHWSYSTVSDVVKALTTEGFVELVSFESILRENETLLEKMVEHDLRIIEQWVEPLKESLEIWSQFVRGLRTELNSPSDSWPDFDDHISVLFMHEAHGYMHHASNRISYMSGLVEQALRTSRNRGKREYRDALRQVLRSYLSYVNANIIISNQLDVGFHDWVDFLPFYHHKFLGVGRENITAETHAKESQKLFAISFPEFAIADAKSLISALEDKRIVSLRKLVQEAVDGKVAFDDVFAKNVLREVLAVEKRIGRYRSLTSYLTMPIGFIPWLGTPTQKLIEEAVDIPLKHKLKKPYQWFYLLSDVAEKATS